VVRAHLKIAEKKRKGDKTIGNETVGVGGGGVVGRKVIPTGEKGGGEGGVAGKGKKKKKTHFSADLRTGEVMLSTSVAQSAAVCFNFVLRMKPSISFRIAAILISL
jgi:hypothetical protein